MVAFLAVENACNTTVYCSLKAAAVEVSDEIPTETIPV